MCTFKYEFNVKIFLQISQVSLYLFVCFHPFSSPSLLKGVQHFWFSQIYLKQKNKLILSPNHQIWNKSNFFTFVQIWKFTWIRFCCNCFCSVHFDHSMLTGLCCPAQLAKIRRRHTHQIQIQTRFPSLQNITFNFFGSPSIILNITALSCDLNLYVNIVVNSTYYWLIYNICDWLFLIDFWLIDWFSMGRPTCNK